MSILAERRLCAISTLLLEPHLDTAAAVPCNFLIPTPFRVCMQAGQPLFQALLELAVAEEVEAVVDCGALLAGATNRWVVC